MQGGTVTEGPVANTNIWGLTNGIFGFSLLLLFFAIRIPDFEYGAGNLVAEQFGRMQLPDILNFLTVFIILLIVWAIVFSILHRTAWIDRTFLYLHFILLMLVIFIPITNDLTILLSGNVAFSILFHANMLSIGLVLFLEWRHCRSRPGLLRQGVPEEGTPFIRASLLVLPVIAFAGCLLAAFHPERTQYLYFLALPAFVILGILMPDRERKSQPVLIRTPDVPAPGEERVKSPGTGGTVPQIVLEMLVCAIFAFALTLIVRTNVHLPSITTGKTIADITSVSLNGMLARGLNFLFVFIIISIFFILFFEIMRTTRENDGIVIGFVSLFILAILFIPLTSRLWAISDKPDIYGLIFHLNILISGLILLFLRKYLSAKPGLCRPGADPGLARNLSLRLLLLPVTAGAGLILDSWDIAFEAIPFAFLYIVPVILFVYLSQESGIAAQPEPAET